MRSLVLAATVVLAAGCTGGTPEPATPPPPPATQQAPAPPPPPFAPPPTPAPVTDNCGLDPSDMDDKTKVQCDLIPRDITEYERYQQDTGYPYSESQYDSLYGYQQCGTACGKEPTSGEIQREWGCQQGYITEGC